MSDASGCKGADALRQKEPLPEELRRFVANERWTYAKTMPKWPHEYLVRARVAEDLFVQIVKHIRTFGYEACFYQQPITYFEEDGHVYWTMGAPVEETIIINRCRTENSYEYRLKNGTPSRDITLPQSLL